MFDEGDDEQGMAKEVMGGILGHAKKMNAQALHDKYAPPPEPEPEAAAPEEGGMPQLTPEQVEQLLALLEAMKAQAGEGPPMPKMNDDEEEDAPGAA